MNKDRMNFHLDEDWKPWIRAFLILFLVFELVLVLFRNVVNVNVFAGNSIQIPPEDPRNPDR